MTTHIARLDNAPLDRWWGYVAGRECYGSQMSVRDEEGSEVDSFSIDYFSDEHDDADIPAEYQCPNLLGYGPGVTLVHETLRTHGWEAVGEPWESPTDDAEYIHVNRANAASTQ